MNFFCWNKQMFHNKKKSLYYNKLNNFKLNKNLSNSSQEKYHKFNKKMMMYKQ